MEVRGVRRSWETLAICLRKLSSRLRRTRVSRSLSSSRPLITFRPTPFKATSPKRMPPSDTVKSASDSLMSGGRRGMLISRHSPMYSATFSLESSTEVSRAAMYSRG